MRAIACVKLYQACMYVACMRVRATLCVALRGQYQNVMFAHSLALTHRDCILVRLLVHLWVSMRKVELHCASAASVCMYVCS